MSKVVETKAVENEKLGWFKVFPDLQDHLGQVQGPGAVPAPKTARSRTRARANQGIDFWAKL